MTADTHPTKPRSNLPLLGLSVAGCIVLLCTEFWAAQEISAEFFEGADDRENNVQRIFHGLPYLNHGKYDGSDLQYHKFRLNLVPLALYFGIVLIWTKKIWERLTSIHKFRKLAENAEVSTTNNAFVKNMLHKKIVSRYAIFYSLHGIGFVLYLHWFTAVYLFVILFFFYLISLLSSSKLNPILTWSLAIVVLFSCDYFKGYYFFQWFFGNRHFLTNLIDKFRGTLPWHIYFRMIMLRVISFNMDKYSSRNNHPVRKSETEYTNRVVQHLPLEYFGIFEFLAYVLYPPLYIAGPIITFNCFITQLASPMKSNTIKERLKTAFWLIFVVEILDVMLHYNCLNAVSNSLVWKNWDESWKVAVVGLWVLQFMYMKFFVFWRFFRVFAMFDNIVAPENMTRCMHSSNTFADFWRAWHSSFNKWTVRYLYVPLGGTKTQHFSIWLIFIFIGLWHDLWWSWVAWALMNCVFFTIELLISFEWKKQRYNWIRNIPGWWILSLLLTGLNGTFILCSNLSLVYGFDHMPTFARLVFLGNGAWKVFALIAMCAFSLVPVQREIRKRELMCPITKKIV